MRHIPGPWGPPTDEPATRAGGASASAHVEFGQVAARRRRRRRLLIASAAIVAIGLGQAVGERTSTGPAADQPALGADASEVEVAATELPAPPAVSSVVVEPDVAMAATTTFPAPLPVPTGSVQSCDELHRFVDEDGDAWGDCTVDVDGAHARAQAIVAFFGYIELTCNTDPVDASSVCEALAPDGAVREMAIAMTGDVTRDIVVRSAPTTTAPPPTAPPPVPAAPVNECDPNYTGCVPIDSDVDCAGGSGNGPSYVRGPVRVIGVDIYGLDGNDNDGVGCE